MKKYLFLAVAALGFAACAEKGLDTDLEPNGELEQSYVAITLAADDMGTKAATDEYHEGTDAERAVKSAYVFFFKDGAAFPVQHSDGTTTNSGLCNYLSVSLNGTTQNMPNVSDIKDAVLVLENYKGEYPNQIVAVLNWDPTGQTSYTLENLREKISTLGNDTDGYVMSNAVYADAKNNTVDAVDLKLENIAKNEDDAIDNPVTIHVERVAAKVAFSATNEGKFAVEKEVNGKPIFAKITGFELYNDYQESWLIKRIEPTWTTDAIGFNWNEYSWYRSYWANSLAKTFESNEFAYNDDNTSLNKWEYCGENTTDKHTMVIVKAQLQDNSGNPVEVASWYGKDYETEKKLLEVVANTLKNTYYPSNDGTETMTEADIKCTPRAVTDDKAYEVYFQLSTTGAAKNWYKKEADGTFTGMDDASFNTILAAVQPALVYTDGQTYYYMTIKHLGAEGKAAEYGVVRNHVYNVKIIDITGYGTPMYDKETEFIKPEKPADVTSYVAAQINILSWRVVDTNNNTTLN